MDRNQLKYLSYMLRLWRTNSHWRASLTDPLTGEQIGFATMEKLIVFLHRQMGIDRDDQPKECAEKQGSHLDLKGSGSA